jgi:hypothetical protein
LSKGYEALLPASLKLSPARKINTHFLGRIGKIRINYDFESREISSSEDHVWVLARISRISAPHAGFGAGLG